MKFVIYTLIILLLASETANAKASIKVFGKVEKLDSKYVYLRDNLKIYKIARAKLPKNIEKKMQWSKGFDFFHMPIESIVKTVDKPLLRKK